jgi:hypothetical protein
MTSVMRAVSVATGPKVMRIGVVRAGRVVEERIVKQRITVTVGASESAMFVIPSAIVPPLFKVFERVGNDYHLNLLDGMTGRIALTTGITDLKGVRGTRVLLTDESRGKVVIGDTTLLFQFVAPPPVQPRPQLPLAVKGSLAGKNDWTLTFIVAFSFLLHFGLVGTMYSDWSDPIIGDTHDIAGLVDLMGKIPAVPPIEVPDQTVPNTTPVKVPTLPSQQPVATQEPSPSHTTTASRPNPGAVSNERAASLAARAEAMQMQTLVALEAGPAVAGAMDRSNVPAVDLSTAAARNVGVVNGTGDIKLASSGPVQGKNNNGLTTLGVTRGDANGGPGKEAPTAGPTGVAQPGPINTNVPVLGADATVAGLRGRFRSCYQQGLSIDSNMSGKVIIAAKIGPNGEVTSSDIASINGLSPAVGQCIAGVVKRATFNAPGPSGASLQIPVTFVQLTK